MLTRKFLAGLGLDQTQIESVIQGHTESVDGLKDDLDKAKAELAEMAAVRKELDEAKKAASQNKVWQDEYESLKKNFEEFRDRQAAQATLASKKTAYAAVLRDLGIQERRIDSILRVTDFDGLSVGEDGKFPDSDSVKAAASKEWGDFIATQSEVGAKVQTPPATNANATTMTKKEIMAIKDARKRQEAIKANPGLFGIEVVQ